MTRSEREAKRRLRISAWEALVIYNAREDELREECYERGVLLWDAATLDDLKEKCREDAVPLQEDMSDDDLRQACREADIVLAEELEIDPAHPLVQAAGDLVYASTMSETVAAVERLRQAFRQMNVYCRATLDLMGRGV